MEPAVGAQAIGLACGRAEQERPRPRRDIAAEDDAAERRGLLRRVVRQQILIAAKARRQAVVDRQQHVASVSRRPSVHNGRQGVAREGHARVQQIDPVLLALDHACEPHPHAGHGARLRAGRELVGGRTIQRRVDCAEGRVAAGARSDARDDGANSLRCPRRYRARRRGRIAKGQHVERQRIGRPSVAREDPRLRGLGGGPPERRVPEQRVPADALGGVVGRTPDAVVAHSRLGHHASSHLDVVGEVSREGCFMALRVRPGARECPHPGARPVDKLANRAGEGPDARGPAGDVRPELQRVRNTARRRLRRGRAQPGGPSRIAPIARSGEQRHRAVGQAFDHQGRAGQQARVACAGSLRVRAEQPPEQTLLHALPGRLQVRKRLLVGGRRRRRQRR